MSNSGLPSAKGIQHAAKLPKMARMGGRRRWKSIRRMSRTPAMMEPDAAEESMAAPTWVMQDSRQQESWRQLCMSKQEWLCEEPRAPNSHLAFNGGEEAASALLLLCLGLRTIAGSGCKQCGSSVKRQPQGEEAKLCSASVGSPTTKVLSELRSIGSSRFHGLTEKTILGDGNCFWRALSKAVGQPWRHLKSKVCRYAEMTGDAAWARHHSAHGVWVDNRGVRYAAEALQGSIHIDAGPGGCWLICAGDECQAWLKLRKGHYSLLKHSDSVSETDVQLEAASSP